MLMMARSNARASCGGTSVIRNQAFKCGKKEEAEEQKEPFALPARNMIAEKANISKV